MINDTDFIFTAFIVTDGDWLVKRFLLKHTFRYDDRFRQTCICTGFHLTCWFGELAGGNLGSKL